MVFPLQAMPNDSSELTKKPLNIQVQYAGNLGLISVGAGKSYFHDKLSFLIIYGYLPKIINGTNVHTFALKTSCKLAVTKVNSNLNMSYYTGITALYGIARNTYLDYPDYFPDGYYNANAIHASFFFGSRLNFNLIHLKLNTISFFTELGTLDYHIWCALKTKYIGFFDIWNLNVGIAFTLK